MTLPVAGQLQALNPEDWDLRSWEPPALDCCLRNDGHQRALSSWEQLWLAQKAQTQGALKCRVLPLMVLPTLHAAQPHKVLRVPGLGWVAMVGVQLAAFSLHHWMWWEPECL